MLSYFNNLVYCISFRIKVPPLNCIYFYYCSKNIIILRINTIEINQANKKTSSDIKAKNNI